MDVEENSISTRKQWHKLQTYEYPKIKDYGDRKFEFKDKSKIREMNAFKVVSTFGYTISEKGLQSRYIKGEVKKDLCDTFGIDLYLLENKVTKAKASKTCESIKGHLVYIMDDGRPHSPDQYCKHSMSITYDALFSQVMKMRVLQNVVEYERYDEK